MAFSGALTLTDLNDFITPSQACIKPVEQTNGITIDQKLPGAAATEIHIDSSGGYYEVADAQGKPKARTKLETAQISLNDCLACSGCITSAESVLITLQSHVEVLSFLSNNSSDSPLYRLPVLSISPQSLASFSASISIPGEPPISLRRVLRRIREFCSKRLGIIEVYDTTFARHISLLEHRKEFMERKSGQGQLPMLGSACPGWVCYAEKTHAEMLPFMSRTRSPQQVMGTLIKNWIGQKCRRSPNEIYHVTVMPCYDKKLEASRQDFYNEVYSTRDVDCVLTTGELALMMREDGWDLTAHITGEDSDQILRPPGDSTVPFLELICHPGTSSGSYLHDIISTISSTLSNPTLSVRTLRSSDYEEYTLSDASTGRVIFKGAKCYGFRNLQNVVRKVGRDAGVQVGRAAALGKMSGGVGVGSRGGRKRINGEAAEGNLKGYDYVEVMACPSGCVNGGGQIKPSKELLSGPAQDEEGFKRDWEVEGVRVGGESETVGNLEGVPVSSKWGDKEWVKRVEEAYWTGLPTPPLTPKIDTSMDVDLSSAAKMAEVDRVALGVLNELCHPVAPVRNWLDAMDEEAETERRKLFRTEYRAVESEVVGLAVKW